MLNPIFIHFMPLLATFDAKWAEESRQDVDSFLDTILDRASIMMGDRFRGVNADH